jgi:NTP pyrophosphatase (non-canonical NTP hydrolase)
MTLNEYQDAAMSTAFYPSIKIDDGRVVNFVYPMLGLSGEVGELSEKFKKSIRDGYHNHEAMVMECGDVLWYLAAVVKELGVTLEDVAQLNLSKLSSRKDRGVLGGSGDGR